MSYSMNLGAWSDGDNVAHQSIGKLGNQYIHYSALWSASASASTHLVKWSQMTKMQVLPSDVS